MDTVYIVTRWDAVLYASTDHASAMEAAQNAADTFDHPGEATAHLLVTGWLGAAAVSTDHVYAQREHFTDPCPGDGYTREDY